MLARWSLSNFKSYNGSKSLSLAPLTLLCGANSSGKSSILQSMLLIKQTLEHSPAERVIALNGPLVQLGTFSDILNDQAKSERNEVIGIGWKIDHRMAEYVSSVMYVGDFRVTNSCLDFSFDVAGPANERATLELQPCLKTSRMSATLTDGGGEPHHVTVEIDRVAGRGRRIQFQSSTLGDDTKLKFRVAEIDPETVEAAGPTLVTSTVVGASVTHFAPSALIVRYDRNLRLAKQASLTLTDAAGVRRYRKAPIRVSSNVVEIMREALTPLSQQPRYTDAIEKFLSYDEQGLNLEAIGQRYREISPFLRRTMREYLASCDRKIENAIYLETGQDQTISLARVEQITKVSNSSDNYFRFLMRYLGPLRADPRPLYPLQALGSPTDVGPKGEQTAAVLHLNAKRKIRTLPSSTFKNNSILAGSQEGTLAAAVGDWLSYLGIADEFETIEKGKLGHELRVRTPGASDFQDLTNVGVGVSQVLPIVVTCLLAPIGSTIILEQPELHLHPAVQARLADFFIAMTLLRKQCVIETHSEHLIERIRFRVAQDLTNTVHENAKIYFFGKDRSGTTVSEISVNRFGSISDWPKDFFDQSQIANEEIVRMALERRKSERSDLNNNKGEV